MQFSGPERERTSGEVVIHQLYEITSDFEAGFDQQVEAVLQLGRETFDLDIGIVAQIEPPNYEVRWAVSPPGVELSRGDRFKLANTYCSMVVDAEGPVGFAHAAESDVVRHPAYGAFRLEAYFGVPLYVNRRRFGTLNFSSAQPRARQFTGVDLDCIRLMATWLGTEIHRRRVEGELAKTRLHLERLVRTDPLTELLNRRGMREAIEGHSRRSERDGLPVSAILIDIDDFKKVNDTLGHSMGDEVIRSVAEHVRASLRPADVAGRIGGDEFVALLPGTTLSDASIVASRISQAVGELTVQDDDLGVTLSIGVASVKPGTSSVTDLLTRTEMLLRDSKQAGKNTVTVEAAAS
ncbi:MAG: GGDEF domain-containing protein [Gemmatimonadetes bacterium]|nr:GGDEF domain-containing protein [Gemmatimonadota bacterium]NNF11865.1 GGDEF domain-containing protein [Gemmatimonadota bacterium]NNL29539.1 GGDEF domain-containing protein [Gemmatimonadota bacterium]